MSSPSLPLPPLMAVPRDIHVLSRESSESCNHSSSPLSRRSDSDRSSLAVSLCLVYSRDRAFLVCIDATSNDSDRSIGRNMPDPHQLFIGRLTTGSRCDCPHMRNNSKMRSLSRYWSMACHQRRSVNPSPRQGGLSGGPLYARLLRPYARQRRDAAAV
jgi:hypothetical protein